MPFDPSCAEIRVGGVTIVENGLGVGDEAEKLAQAFMRTPRYVVELELGKGPGAARYFMCDLTHEYVNVNADYRS